MTLDSFEIAGALVAPGTRDSVALPDHTPVDLQVEAV